MGSKKKATVLVHKGYFEAKLDKRLSYLAETGIEQKRIEKDTVVKKIRSKIRETNARLKAIAEIESKTEALARAKAEKLAAAQKKKAAQAEVQKGKPEKGKKSKAAKKDTEKSPEESGEKKKKQKKTETDE